MNLEKDITKDEMIAVFLKGEVDSPQFGTVINDQLKKSGKNRKIIDEPDFLSIEENNDRKSLLQISRGYERNVLLFENFPEDIQWKRMVLDKADLSKIKYINCPRWPQLSNSSRLPLDGAKNAELIKKCQEMVNTLKQGGSFFEVILVALNEKMDLIILDGNHRMTAYFMTPQYIPEKLKCIIGFSENIKNWRWY